MGKTGGRGGFEMMRGSENAKIVTAPRESESRSETDQGVGEGEENNCSLKTRGRVKDMGKRFVWRGSGKRRC